MVSLFVQVFLLKHQTMIPSVSSVKFSFALRQVGHRTTLPLGHLEK